jgi:RNA polymerase sigma factor (sigma-70 family)
MDHLKAATDQQLLREYLEGGSETAFGVLVERHVHLVFGTARRRLADEQTARELTQNVFATLARKAAWLLGEASLANWLHRSAILETRQWWRGELRRRRREQTASELATSMQQHTEPSLLNALTPLLDEGLMSLRETERQALILRFFENRTHREIGSLLGTGEDAARKRVDKALHQLTAFFRRQGYALPTTAITVAALEAGAVVAPVGLAAAAAQLALAGGSGVSLGGIGLLFAKFMALTKTQTAALSLALAAAPLGYQWNQVAHARSQAAELRTEISEAGKMLAQLDQDRSQIEARLNRLGKSSELLQAETERQLAVAATARTNRYLWSDRSDFVRVPKSLVNELTLAEAEYLPLPDETRQRRQKPVLSEDGMISQVMREVLEITPAQAAQVQQQLQAVAVEVRSIQQASLIQTNRPPPAYFSDLAESRTVITQPFPERGAALRDWLNEAWNQALGEPRAAVLWEQSKDSLEDRFHHFGARAKYETVFWDDKGVAYGTAFRGSDDTAFLNASMTRRRPANGALSDAAETITDRSWFFYGIPGHLHPFLPAPPNAGQAVNEMTPHE